MANPPVITTPVVVANNLVVPWEIAFLPDGSFLVTSRDADGSGNFNLNHISSTFKVTLAVPNTVTTGGEGGLMGVAVDPSFSTNGFIYLCHTTSYNGGYTTNGNEVIRYVFNATTHSIGSPLSLLRYASGQFHNGGTVKFGPDNKLYITTGNATNPGVEQDVTNNNGKILRINNDGSIPSDNPFSGRATWTFGHRNPQGICWDSAGLCWSSENGPTGETFGNFSGIQGNDKINLITKGKNYGFPLTYGVNTTTDASGNQTIAPALCSGNNEAWAPEGIEAFGNSIFFCALGGIGNVGGTPGLDQSTRTGNALASKVVRFGNTYGRLRSLVNAPDGYAYFSTSNGDGRGGAARGTDVIYKVSLSQFDAAGSTPTTPNPTTTTPTPTGTYITRTSGGSVTDAGGNTWTLDSTGALAENGSLIPGGTGTGLLTVVNGVIWATDQASGTWYTYVNGAFVSMGTQTPPAPSVPTPTPTTPTPTTNIPTPTTPSVPTPPTPTTPGTRNWYENPGMDGSFWVQPFYSSANWITSGLLVTALRNGTHSSPTGTINMAGNFSAPWYIGKRTDPLVTVTDGTKTIQVHLPLGAVDELPASSVDQTIGGSDQSQPYLIWSISGSSINTGSVQASGSVITGTYGLQIDDGSGPIMVDQLTGQPGTNNAIGALQDYELSLANANANYVIQHMLAFQMDPTQASSAGPIWPLKVIDGGATYTGIIPQGITIGIPASTPRPTGKTRGFYLLWDNLQQYGWFNYNFGNAGATFITCFSTNPANTALANDCLASISAVMASVCILNYNSGVAGAQYSVATTKGFLPNATSAFPDPPPLDLSPTGGKNVAPSTFGAWYPSNYNVIPTNTVPGTPTPTTPTPTTPTPTTPTPSTGPGPGVTGNFINVDFTNLTSAAGKANVIVQPQLFGVSSGGFDNNNWQWVNNATFRSKMRALNLPLFRVHSQWQAKGNAISTLISNIGSMVPSTCTMIIGLDNPATAQTISNQWRQSPIPCTLWEQGNEHGYDQAAINTMIAGLQADNPANRVAGDVNAGFSTGQMASMVNAMSSSTLGLLDEHQYLYCSGSDPTPSNASVCLADGYYRQLAQQLDQSISSGYGRNLPYLMGEYNIECGASSSDLRAGTSIGACFLISSLFGMQDATLRPMWGAIWDLMDDGGAAYNLIDSNFNTYPQYYTLQRLIATMPGTLVNSGSGSSAVGLKAWATKNGTGFGVAIVNSNANAVSGSVALSHWPVNASGTGTATLWTYPTTSLTAATANVPGVTSSITVSGGLTQSITIPGSSCVILSVPTSQSVPTTPTPTTTTPTPVTPTPTSGYITRTSGGSVTDASGQVWTLDSAGELLVNGVILPGGQGTGLLTVANGVIWATDFASGTWYTYVNGSFVSMGTQTPPVVTSTGTPASQLTVVNGLIWVEYGTSWYTYLNGTFTRQTTTPLGQ